MAEATLTADTPVEVDKTQIGWDVDEIDAAAEDFNLLIDTGY